jgi:hypothetical protein
MKLVAASIVVAGLCIAAAIVWEGRTKFVPYGQYMVIYDRFEGTTQVCGYLRDSNQTKPFCGEPVTQ